MSVSRLTVLVSGAGIAGPTLAYWLLRRGFKPILIERAPRLRKGGYIVDFWGVGFDVADRMGLLPMLREAGYVIDRIEFVKENGGPRSSFGGNALRRTLGDRFLSIQRGDLSAAICGTVGNNVETIFGDSITGFEQHSDRVDVTFERGGPRAFHLVIGADGLHSAVRNVAFGAREAFESFLGYYAASFITEDYPKRTEHTYLSYAAPGRQISRYALRGGLTAFFFVFRSQEKIAHDVGAQKRHLRETFSREPWTEWPEIERRLNACRDLYFDAVSQIKMPSWSHGRVALVGDAAYCPSLLAGEGSAFAMAGAYILAGELERAGGDHARAFAAYEQCFRPFVEGKQKSARAFASSFAPATAFGLFARDQVLRLSAIPVVADHLMKRFVADRFALPEYSARAT